MLVVVRDRVGTTVGPGKEAESVVIDKRAVSPCGSLPVGSVEIRGHVIGVIWDPGGRLCSGCGGRGRS